MKKKDIDAFIQIMKEIQEDWTPKEVEEKYGECTTLKEAIDKRLSKINTFYDFIEEKIMPDVNDTEMMGFLGMGNNPMAGATVAVAVAVEESPK